MAGARAQPEVAGSAAPTHAADRDRRALWTTLSALGGRGLGILLSLVSLPLTVNYLDAERYGLWVTIGSFLAWLSLADLGLGNGISNLVTAARARGDHEAARRAVSAAFVMLGGISVAMALVFAAAFPFVPWARVLAVTARVDARELHVTVALCLAVFALGFPLGIVDRVLAACQEGYIANGWASATAALATAALVVVLRFGSGLPLLVVALSVVPLAVRAASTAWVFTRRHPELRPSLGAFQRDVARSLLGTGGSFLVVQLAALGMWQNDNIIISQLFGASAVGPYSVAFRLAYFATGLVNMWLAPLWPAYADAHARRDYAWIRATLRRTMTISLAAMIAAGGGMVLFGQQAILLWTRKAEMVPSRRLLLPMAVFMVLVTFCQVNATALNGLGRLRGQMMYGIAAAVINVALSIVLGRSIGIEGVCWATCIAAMTGVLIQPFELRHVLRQEEARAAASIAPGPD